MNLAVKKVPLILNSGLTEYEKPADTLITTR